MSKQAAWEAFKAGAEYEYMLGRDAHRSEEFRHIVEQQRIDYFEVWWKGGGWRLV